MALIIEQLKSVGFELLNYHLGPDVTMTLQIPGCVVGILAVMHFLSVFLLAGCHSAPSWLTGLVQACQVAFCSAVKNRILSVWVSCLSVCVRVILKWGFCGMYRNVRVGQK